jgi:small subunit ribosomal protein S4e
MVKNHLKSIAAPETWPIERKKRVFVLKPNPGTHKLENCVSLNFLLETMLKIANVKKEVKYILTNKEILVDGVRRNERSFPVGLFDVVSIKDIKKYYRIIIDQKGKLKLIPIDEKEANIKPCKITGKNLVGKKIQLNLYDGRNILVEKTDYKIGDTLAMSLDKKEIKEHLNLEKVNLIFLIGGKQIGQTGIIEDIIENRIIYRNKGHAFETLKKYAFVIGKDKPIVKVE